MKIIKISFKIMKQHNEIIINIINQAFKAILKVTLEEGL